MIDYINAKNQLFTRGVNIDTKDYLFSLMIVNGEREEVAYAIVYDLDEFEKYVNSEHEEQYLFSKEKEAKVFVQHVNITQTIDLLKEAYRTEIQTQALNLKDYKFTSNETIQILNNLLKTRVDDLEGSSVKDIVGIIKILTEKGALAEGDGGFSKHFIQVYPKFNALCVNCGREFEIARGVHGICPSCGQKYSYSENEDRFYPEPYTL